MLRLSGDIEFEFEKENEKENNDKRETECRG